MSDRKSPDEIDPGAHMRPPRSEDSADEVTGRQGPIGGRFASAPAGDFQRYSSTIDLDLRMLDEDVDGSVAHVAVLELAGLLDADEAKQLVAGLEAVRAEIRDGHWRPGDALEDIHMAIETRLFEHVGDVAKKLHTARSRNDQVATDVRLWLVRRIRAIEDGLARLIGVLLDRVNLDGRTLMPGYTHLQRGQPILLGHQLLAHIWPLVRDRERFAGARFRLDRSPLGAGALAGTPYPIDRLVSAERLGFLGPVENAMDAVAARDHEQETAAACAIASGHLSRMAEELVLWSSTEMAFVRLGEDYSTGSSIMPQKRNPDAPELVRAKAARVAANLQAVLAIPRTLPMAYNRDLQESREPLFDAVDTTLESIGIMTGVWRSLDFEIGRYERALRGDFSLATEIADHLAKQGVPFRDAHHLVGRIVRHCEREGKRLDDLTAEEAATFHPALGDEDLQVLLDPRAAVARRTSLGGTAWPEIERQVDILRRLVPTSH
ncbi:MAG: argininosuccinate lyase [Acidobacteriota bacterium]